MSISRCRSNKSEPANHFILSLILAVKKYRRSESGRSGSVEYRRTSRPDLNPNRRILAISQVHGGKSLGVETRDQDLEHDCANRQLGEGDLPIRVQSAPAIQCFAVLEAFQLDGRLVG